MASIGSGLYKNRIFLINYIFICIQTLVKTLTAADKLRDLLSQLDNQGSPSSPSHHSSSPKVYTNH
jgi:hypothetical protein